MKIGAGKIILGVLGLSVLWAVMRDPPSNYSSGAAAPAKAPPPAAAAKYDKSADAQAKREKTLKEANKGGLVGKVDCRSSGADVWVNPMFEAISMDTKRGLAITVHQWCFDGPDSGFVRIRSNQTDKELGMYRPDAGLDLE
jgi:hypothetical protein